MCLSLWTYWWLGKIYSNIITWKRRFLHSLKYERYYWYRLCARKKILQRFWNKTFRRISGFVSSKRYIIVSCVFEKFRNICREIYELDHAKFLSGPRLVWQIALKNTKAKLGLLTNIDILLIVEKVMRGATYQYIHQYAIRYTNKKYY